MKVRIGIGVDGAPPVSRVKPFELTSVVDDLDELGFDSIWVPELLTGETLDPLVALAIAAAHNSHLKLGATLLLPGRNLVRAAKALASLDALSAGRLLITFVPGINRGLESGAAGLAQGGRGAAMDEMLPALRSLWAGEPVSFRGEAGTFDDLVLRPLPHQRPLEFWTGGMAPAALRRCGRLADGWLPSACTPEEAAKGRTVIEASAAEAGRSISEEHYGVALSYSVGPLEPVAVAALAASRMGADPKAIVPIGIHALRATLRRFIDVGFTKFVVRPFSPPDSWRSWLESVADGVLDLQT